MGTGEDLRRLTLEEAKEFAQMVLAGAPVGEVVPYFCDGTESEAQRIACERQWTAQREVVEALEVMLGGVAWHRMTDPQRLDAAVTKHYNELAYFLWTTNYAEADEGTKLKADTCRTAIEAKVAGMAGRESPLAQFYHDLLARYDTQKTTVQ